MICFLTNISQMPFLVEAGYTRFLSLPIWLILFGVNILFNRHLKIKKIKGFLFVLIIFLVLHLLLSMFNASYSDSALLYPILVSAFVLIVGLMSGDYIDTDGVSSICTSYVISGVLVCANVYMKYVAGSTTSEIGYLYSSKNSVSQILLTAWAIILINKFGKCKGLIKNLIYVVFFVLLTYTMLGLKSRATILGMPLILVVVIINGRLDKRLKWITVFLVAFIVLYLAVQPEAYNVLVNDILLANRGSGDLDAISSGRASQWKNFYSQFKDSWLFGHGADAKESLILTALLEYGVMGGSLIFIMALWPLVWCMNSLKYRNIHYVLFVSLALVYVFNGIFEQLAPFGPGVKCYFIWFLMGILKNNREKVELKYEE